MRVTLLVTGGREWPSNRSELVRDVIRDFVWRHCNAGGLRMPHSLVTVLHGHAIGTDTIAGRMAQRIGCNVVGLRPDYVKWGNDAPLRRNDELIRRAMQNRKNGEELFCAAFPVGHGWSGTRYTMDRFEKRTGIKPVEFRYCTCCPVRERTFTWPQEIAPEMRTS